MPTFTIFILFWNQQEIVKRKENIIMNIIAVKFNSIQTHEVHYTSESRFRFLFTLNVMHNCGYNFGTKQKFFDFKIALTIKLISFI